MSYTYYIYNIWPLKMHDYSAVTEYVICPFRPFKIADRIQYYSALFVKLFRKTEINIYE